MKSNSKQIQYHMITFAAILSMPITQLDTIIQDIENNPEKVEKASKRKTFLPLSRNQPATPIDTERLENLLEEPIPEPEWDVSYMGVKKQIPITTFTQPLVDEESFKPIVLPGKYPLAEHLYENLVREREKVYSKLRQIYAFIGEYQRRFINTGNKKTIRVLTDGKIAREFRWHETTISRLLRSRHVLVEHTDGRTGTYPIRALLSVPNTVLRYHSIPTINEMFEQELRKGESFKDTEMVEQINQRLRNVAGVKRVARRTVCKYRGEGNVPGMQERKAAYRDGREEPFVIQNPLITKSPGEKP